MNAVPLALLLLTPGSLVAQGLRLEGGAGVSTGTYLFEARTTTWSATAGLALELGGLTLRGSVPVYLQNSTLVAGAGPGQVPTGGSSGGAVADSGRARRQGTGMGRMASAAGAAFSHGKVEVPGSAAAEYQSAVGDPVVALGWRTRGAGATTLRLGAAVKAPVADTATFGTGQWDVGASAGVSRRLTDRLLLGLDLAWWRLGDMDELELRDPVYGTVSLGYLGPTGWGWSVLASGGTSVLEGFDAPLLLGGGIHRASGATSWGVLATAGLTETAPDLTLGAIWSLRLTR